MTRMIDILRKLRNGEPSDRGAKAPGQKRKNHAKEDGARSGVIQALDSALSAEPPVPIDAEASPVGIEQELRSIFAGDGSLAAPPQPAQTNQPAQPDPGADTPSEVDSTLAEIAKLSASEAPEIVESDTIAEPAEADELSEEPAAIDPEPASPSDILSQAEKEALLGEPESTEAPHSNHPIEEPAIQPHSVEPVDDPAPPGSPTDAEDTAEEETVSSSAPQQEELPSENVAAAAQEASDMASDIENSIDLLATTSADETQAPSEPEAEPIESASPIEADDALESDGAKAVPVLNDEFFADDLADPILAKYGINPEDIKLPTRQEWENRNNEKTLSSEGIEAQRQALLAEMGLDLDTLREEHAEWEPDEPEELEDLEAIANLSASEVPPAEAPIEDLTQENADQEAGQMQPPAEPDAIEVAASAQAEEDATATQEVGAPSALNAGLHALASNGPKETDDASIEPAEPEAAKQTTEQLAGGLTASGDLKAELEQEFEQEVAALAPSAPSEDLPEPAPADPVEEMEAIPPPVEAAPVVAPIQQFAGSFLSPDTPASPMEDTEEVAPAVVVVATNASHEELMQELHADVETETVPDDFTRNPGELVKLLVGVLSLILIVAVLLAWALSR